MKIDSSFVQAQSSHQSIAYSSTTYKKSVSTVAQPLLESLEEKVPAGAAEAEGNATVDISAQAKEAMEKSQQAIKDAGEKLGSEHSILSRKMNGTGLGKSFAMSEDQIKSSLIEQMFKALTGKEAKVARIDLDQNGSITFNGKMSQKFNNVTVLQGFNAQPMQLMQHTEQTFESMYYESESVSYSAQGIVNTTDGRSINVDVQLNMSREFAAYASVSQSFTTKLVDPLVVNFGGDPGALTQTKYEFDLDADGVMDQISFAGPGSGFLALDKNGDGQINDGNELFGPQSGNGFEELRKYDSDGNGWIDENDEIFSKLRIWSKDANGKDQLFTLLEADIGAIYLGDVETQFSLNDESNTTHGMMRSTSFYLRENGGAGTVSHIDLTT